MFSDPLGNHCLNLFHSHWILIINIVSIVGNRCRLVLNEMRIRFRAVILSTKRPYSDPTYVSPDQYPAFHLFSQKPSSNSLKHKVAPPPLPSPLAAIDLLDQKLRTILWA
jgi:hypothetical protein